MKHMVRGKEANADGLSGQQEFIKNKAEEVNLDELREVRRKEMYFEMLIEGEGRETAQNMCEYAKWVVYVRFEIKKVGK